MNSDPDGSTRNSNRSASGPSQSHARFWKLWRKKEENEENEDNEEDNAETSQSQFPPVPYWSLFKYATRAERLMIIVALVVSAVHGALVPVLTVTYGSVLDDFGRAFKDPDDPDYVPLSGIASSYETTTNLVLGLAFASLVLSLFELYFALEAANSIGNTLRTLYFESLISQDCDFYDAHDPGALSSLLVTDINLIQAGIGDKLVTTVQYAVTFGGGVIVAFVHGWKLSLVLFTVTPLLMITGLVFGNASARATGEGLGVYAEAGGIASEALSMIRTVTAFGGQHEESSQYESSLRRALKSSIKGNIVSAIGLGTAMLIILSSYSLSFWYGSRLVRDLEVTPGDVLLIFLSIALGASLLGQAGPAFKSFGLARAAAPRVFDVIDRSSAIDPLGDDGLIPENPTKGYIKFENVNFNYQNRITEDGDSDLVLDNFNLDMQPGTSEAFVGKSGCGKSTVARLIMRFYDPLSGRVLLDGTDIRELNVRWLRSQIGIVPQTPTLFMMSIRDNIALGAGMTFHVDEKTGKRWLSRQVVSDKDIISAARLANAHGFIMKLPQQYDTMLGERGAMLSGGQRQRICIARALLRKPKILLLDESTSSLDTVSERIVQKALEKVSSGRTTLTIAHRLSTVRNSNSISFISKGKILERGSHEQLLSIPDGHYRSLIELQNVEAEQSLDQGDTTGREAITQAIEGKGQLSRDETMSESHTGTSPHAGESTQASGKDLQLDNGIFRRTLTMNIRQLPLLITGLFGAACDGVVLPLTSIPLIQVTNAMLRGNDQDEVNKWCLVFLGLAGLGFLGSALQSGGLGIYGEKLVSKLRCLAFRNLLRQEIGFFDMKENTVGSLTSRLSSDAGAVKGLTGDSLGVIISVTSAVVSGLVIAFASCWQLAFIILAVIPGLSIGAYLEVQASAGIDSGARGEFATATNEAKEAIDNVGTVRHLGIEDYFLDSFRDGMAKTVPSRRKKGLVTSLFYSFSEFCKFMIWFVAYKAGGSFVEKDMCPYTGMFRTTLALMFGALSLGRIAVFAPDFASSKVSAHHVYRLIDRKSQIDPNDESGDDYRGSIDSVKLEDVHFEYPRRPSVRVLKGLSLEVEGGQTVAIVGPSGQGKSTIVALLERFYSIRRGRIAFDDQDVSRLNVSSVRSNLGYVPQEPELFNRSIFDNIAYGTSMPEGSAISMEHVVEAAKEANAHEFISALPQGYDTVVGMKGDALSGGQRQRVAIARSLIRKPQLLLLDEATSALDSNSERLIQMALEKAVTGRTTILVAHRLSTIRNADVIAVVGRGRIVECGTHDELLRLNGKYKELVEHQLSML